MPSLPQELIDLIIDHFHEYERGALKACSLVCSQWSVRSRKRLFQTVRLHSKAELERWCMSIRPGPSGPSSLVESLSLIDAGLSMSMADSSRAQLLQQPILSDAAPYLGSFSGLRVLEIVGWGMDAVQVPLMLHCVGPSFETVTHLELRRILFDPSAFTTFIGHFPRLDYLSIHSLGRHWGRDGAGDLHHGSPGNVVPTRLDGEFLASGVPGYLFNSIVLLEPRFRKVSLWGNGWRDFWPPLEACSGSLEELGILGWLEGV